MKMEKDNVASFISSIRTFGSLIKFSHTVFALPFAFTSLVFASYQVPVEIIIKQKLIWIILAMVGARSAAMGFNRVVDRSIDAQNPRTQTREIPAGKISVSAAWIFIVIASAALIFASYMLNELCFYLSPVALAAVFFYSFTKRFTWMAHLFLGLGLGLAPVGAWIAITGEFGTASILLGIAVMIWTAGFDIIYACQDFEFDKMSKLNSIPVKFGIETSLHIAKSFHAGMVIILCLIFFLVPTGLIYILGILSVVMLLIYEHRLVNAKDLSNLNMAFFNMNGIIASVLFIFVLLDRIF